MGDWWSKARVVREEQYYHPLGDKEAHTYTLCSLVIKS